MNSEIISDLLMHGSRGGGGPDPLLKNHKAIGFLSNTAPDPLKDHFKLPSQQQGAQWLSGRVLDSRPKGRGFEPHRRHCVVVFEQDTFILA